ncbi:PREDICTED: ribonuclease inhibitor [Dipodomys ordii]|uniref:Ribonuclease inhibitor n=1 Tax=Dipodomys ordii TaxID=10020 RepID=A0A1S3GLB5_DIPOR|nr:PREDICTED: ribonuclease inhibitor [Dipodomys ordii]
MPTMDLNIQCEQLSDSRWAELLPRIQQCQWVRLDDCGLSEVRCKDLSSALQANPALTELNLRNNELGNAGVQLVLQGLQSPTCRIQKLSLQNCGLTAAGCAVLPGVLCALSTLRELCLSDNPFGDTGLQLLCEGLLDARCHLERLQCGQRSSVGDTGSDHSECHDLVLTSVPPPSRLGDCDVTNNGCSSLASALLANHSLRVLELSNNCMGDPGVQRLVDSLRQPGCALALEKLVLYDIYWTQAMEDQLQALEEARPSLRVIS